MMVTAKYVGTLMLSALISFITNKEKAIKKNKAIILF